MGEYKKFCFVYGKFVVLVIEQWNNLHYGGSNKYISLT
jgi:hypothetical protein